MTTGFNIGNSLTTRAYLNPTREALYDVAANQRFTFAQLDARANQCCAVLQSLGLRRGDRAALMLHNGHEFIESFFGPAKAGIVLMPLNWRLTADELSFILKDGGARVIILKPSFAPLSPNFAPAVPPAAVLSTGSVGQDKPDFSCPTNRRWPVPTSMVLRNRPTRMTTCLSCTHLAQQAVQKAWCTPIKPYSGRC